MTLLTRDPSLHVALVIELKVVRHYVNLDPRNWLAVLVVLFELLDILLPLLTLSGNKSTVATHAGFDLRYRRVRSLSYGPVTILTLHLVLLNVDYMAKVDRLLWLVSSLPLLWTEVVEVVPNVKVPQSSLPVIVHTGANSDLWIL